MKNTVSFFITGMLKIVNGGGVNANFFEKKYEEFEILCLPLYFDRE